MGRRVTLDQCRSYRDFEAFAVQHGATIEPARGSHEKIKRDGHTIAVMAAGHGEPGPGARCALKKVLAVLLLLAALVCALAYLAPLVLAW